MVCYSDTLPSSSLLPREVPETPSSLVSSESAVSSLPSLPSTRPLPTPPMDPSLPPVPSTLCTSPSCPYTTISNPKSSTDKQHRRPHASSTDRNTGKDRAISVVYRNGRIDAGRAREDETSRRTGHQSITEVFGRCYELNTSLADLCIR